MVKNKLFWFKQQTELVNNYNRTLKPGGDKWKAQKTSY